MDPCVNHALNWGAPWMRRGLKVISTLEKPVLYLLVSFCTWWQHPSSYICANTHPQNVTHHALNYFTILTSAAVGLWENTDFMMLMQPLSLQSNSASLFTHRKGVLGSVEVVARQQASSSSSYTQSGVLYTQRFRITYTHTKVHTPNAERSHAVARALTVWRCDYLISTWAVERALESLWVNKCDFVEILCVSDSQLILSSNLHHGYCNSFITVGVDCPSSPADPYGS